MPPGGTNPKVACSAAPTITTSETALSYSSISRKERFIEISTESSSSWTTEDSSLAISPEETCASTSTTGGELKEPAGKTATSSPQTSSKALRSVSWQSMSCRAAS